MIKYRNEWKYVLPRPELEQIKKRIETIMNKDLNSGESGCYEIHSLYFDDLFDSALLDNNAGVSERFKYRIRYYGRDTEHLKLEKKIKKSGMCRKESCTITREQYEAIMSQNPEKILFTDEPKLLTQFVVDILNRGYKPKVIIDYVRFPFTSEVGNVRITFDEQISACGEVEKFLWGDYMSVPVMKGDDNVLEVKFDEVLPGYIRHTIDGGKLIQTSNSKYYMGRKCLSAMTR